MLVIEQNRKLEKVTSHKNKQTNKQKTLLSILFFFHLYSRPVHIDRDLDFYLDLGLLITLGKSEKNEENYVN